MIIHHVEDYDLAILFEVFAKPVCKNGELVWDIPDWLHDLLEPA